MKKSLIYIFAFLTFALRGQDTLSVNASDLKVSSDTVSFQINFQNLHSDSLFIANGTLVFTFDTAQFTNPSLSIENISNIPTRNNNRSAFFKPSIEFGTGFNENKALIFMYPMTPMSQANFDDHVYYLDSSKQYEYAKVSISGFTGDASKLGLQWVSTGGRADNKSKLKTFEQPVTASFNTQQAYYSFDEFPGLNDVNFHLTVFLEGPYNAATGEMNTTLNQLGYLPLSQPYNVSPWNYAGTESVAAMPNNNVVDWVLIEIREAANVNSAVPSTKIGQRAGLLLKNGEVADLDGVTPLTFADLELDPNKEQFVVVYHRNHMAVMSASQLILSGGELHYDFTQSIIFARGGTDGAKLIDATSGIYGMVAGDINGDGVIKYTGANNDDMEIYSEVGGSSIVVTTNGYKKEDLNLDGVVKFTGSNNDSSLIYRAIGGSSVVITKSSQVVK